MSIHSSDDSAEAASILCFRCQGRSGELAHLLCGQRFHASQIRIDDMDPSGVRHKQRRHGVLNRRPFSLDCFLRCGGLKPNCLHRFSIVLPCLFFSGIAFAR